MKRVLLFSLLFMFVSHLNTIAKVHAVESQHMAVLENGIVKLEFDLKKGTYKAIDVKTGKTGLYNVAWKINNYSSKDADSTYFQKYTISNNLGKGYSIELTSIKSGCPDLVFQFDLYEGEPFVLMRGGIRNTTTSAFCVKEIYPVFDGQIFEGMDISKNFKALDGEGGAAATYIRERPSLLSQNNMIIHFGEENKFHSLVGGGISYAEFSKFAQFGEDAKRKKSIMKESIPGLKFVSYHDLGEPESIDYSSPYIIVSNPSDYLFNSAGSFKEAKTVVWDNKEIVMSLKRLEKNKKYIVGLSWCDDTDSRKQSVHLRYNNREVEVIPTVKLPSLEQGMDAQIHYFEIPVEANGSTPQIIVRKESGVNAVVSEAILYEGKLPARLKHIPHKIQCEADNFDNCKINLFAKDAVGKLVDMNQSYITGNDEFYIDFITTNPIYSAEKYAAVLKQRQQIKLNHYYFPTVCLWYAMEPRYGGDIVMGTNDAVGAVEEMQRIRDSGFLKYTTAAVRLVPDCYGDNNENGWWDDEHWRMHGSGKQGPGMKLKGAHYRLPYDTTKKWAEKIKELGGLPFTYFQTAVRSNDYAEAHPEHMLFNEAYHKIDKYDALNKNFTSYDFTDKGFLAHMRQVYKNLRDGGIAGMMFDYPYTGWPLYGGMDDKYSTAAGAYRTIYQLAHEGLGDDAYIHERNLVYGSDIALGYVESQRTWGDTDVLTPEMVMKSGLRWYKNRVVVNYDMDAKNLLKAKPMNNSDGLNKLLTMSYITASRLLLANSFGVLTPDHVFKLSRVYPFQQNSQSARPLDAFSSDYPRVYGYKVNEDWCQLTFFNEDEDKAKMIGVQLNGIEGKGGAGLDSNQQYYIYDFWNDQLIGKYDGTAYFEQTVREGEARQMAVRKVLNHPQILSTDRHLMQGMLELSNIRWDEATQKLHCTTDLVEGETMSIIIANNGFTPQQASIEKSGKISVERLSEQLTKVKVLCDKKSQLTWSISFKE